MRVNLEPTVICHISYRSDNPTARSSPTGSSEPTSDSPNASHTENHFKSNIIGSRKEVSTWRSPCGGRRAHTLEARASSVDCAAPNPELSRCFSAGAFRFDTMPDESCLRKPVIRGRKSYTQTFDLLFSSSPIQVFAFWFSSWTLKAIKSDLFCVPSDRFTEVLPLCSRTWSGVRLLRACRRPVRFRLGGILFVSLC